LDVPSRLKLRVNKRLNEIEKETKFHVDFMIIEQGIHGAFGMFVYFGKDEAHVERERKTRYHNVHRSGHLSRTKEESFIRFLPRFAATTTFGRIALKVAEVNATYPLSAFISKVYANFLHIEKGINDANIIALIENKKNVECWDWIRENYQSETIHRVYEALRDDSNKLESFTTILMDLLRVTYILRHLGIDKESGFKSSNHNVEIFSHGNELVVLDGTLRSSFTVRRCDEFILKIDKYGENDENTIKMMNSMKRMQVEMV
ncbi:hypothetical protein PFISCL1PPCAC_19215, partial [Pristionchus fissidentatus]